MNADTKNNKAWYKRPKVIILIVLALIFFGLLGSDQEANESQQDDTNPAVSNETIATTAQLDEPVRDGKFEFIVNDMSCGAKTVGDNEFLTEEAQGQFCLITLSVKNIGNEPQSLFSDNQYLFDANGQKYASDSTATIYANDDNSDTWISEINPGNSVEGVIVFDVPQSVTPSKIKLHDSALSGGVEVFLN